jgi:hypothetical protein
MQSPSDISVAVATQLTFGYNRGYFLGNGLRRFHRSVSSGFQHVTLLPSKGCSSPNSLTVLPLFQVFCWQRLHSVLLFFSRHFVVFLLLHPPLSSVVLAPSTCMVQRSHIHSSHSFALHSPLRGRPVLLPPVPPIRVVSLFSFWRGSAPPRCPIFDR